MNTKREAIIAVREFCAMMANEDTSSYRPVWQKACSAPTDFALEYLLIYSFGFCDGAFSLGQNPTDKIMADTIGALSAALNGAPGSLENVRLLGEAHLEAKRERLCKQDAERAIKAEETKRSVSARNKDLKFN